MVAVTGREIVWTCGLLVGAVVVVLIRSDGQAFSKSRLWRLDRVRFARGGIAGFSVSEVYGPSSEQSPCPMGTARVEAMAS
jgi:hypothetical protein